jgi:hypothetical protein
MEGTPLAMVEAMICGRPIVGTAVAGIPEWVRDGYTGFIANGPDVRSYGEALERAWERKAEWRAMGQRARDEALRLYDPAPGDSLVAIILDLMHKQAEENPSDNRAHLSPNGYAPDLQ